MMLQATTEAKYVLGEFFVSWNITLTLYALQYTVKKASDFPLSPDGMSLTKLGGE